MSPQTGKHTPKKSRAGMVVNGWTVEGLRDTGFRFETAVADLIDNAIAAEATKVDVRLERSIKGELRLAIADDGYGMNRADLVQAMHDGPSKRPHPVSLGKYGLGLKTASTAFCRRFSLISRSSGNLPALMVTWDLNHVVKSQDWLLQYSTEPDEEALEHLDDVASGSSGTVVLWNEVDRLLSKHNNPAGNHARKALKQCCGQLHDHIAMTYQRFLDTSDDRAHNVDIWLNGKLIIPWDPFQKKFSELVAEESVEVEGAGTWIWIRAYILPRRDAFPEDRLAKEAKLSSEMQGLYIYREQRLIHQADWLGMFLKEPRSSLLRVEFSYDHKLDYAFQIDVKKPEIILNETIWKVLKNQILMAPRREANRRYLKARLKDIAKRAKHVHEASNNLIRNKAADFGGVDVNISNPVTGEVTVKNGHGQFRIKLKTCPAARSGEVFVQPAEDVDDGLLFEPALIEQHKAVRINIQHPYYQKVYVPNHDSSVTVQGMDSLLWALCVAELGATSDKTEEAFKDMRYELSHILRKLVESLPDSEIE